MPHKLIIGAAAGVLGGLAMKAVVRFVDPDAFGLSAHTDAKSAQVLWRKLGLTPLSEAAAEQVGAAMHYGFAAASGAAYAAWSPRFPVIRAGSGAVFGLVLWAVGDELAVTVADLEDPRGTPIRSHVSALAAHVLFGFTVAAIASQTQDS